MARDSSLAGVRQLAPLDEVVLTLKRGLGSNLIAVVVFGSRARNDAREESDWDLLVIAYDLPSSVFKRHIWVKSLLPRSWRAQASVIAKTPDEFSASLSPLFLDIALDGLILYDTDDFLSTRLAFLRRLIEERGLERQRSQTDFLWRWKQFPGFDWSLDWEQTA
jgi:hypothetical protein